MTISEREEFKKLKAEVKEIRTIIDLILSTPLQPKRKRNAK